MANHCIILHTCFVSNNGINQDVEVLKPLFGKLKRFIGFVLHLFILLSFGLMTLNIYLVFVREVINSISLMDAYCYVKENDVVQ